MEPGSKTVMPDTWGEGSPFSLSGYRQTWTNNGHPVNGKLFGRAFRSRGAGLQ